MRIAYANAAIWALGNGLASTTLVVYLALELDAAGLGISLILAAPQLVGVLRWWAAAAIGRLFDRKRFCIACYIASAAVLLWLPFLAAPGMLGTIEASLAALVLLWCSYHLLEYFGTVALWSWFGDLVPSQVRGRFIGRREAWLVGGRIVGMIAVGLFTQWWRSQHAPEELWIGYAISAGLGAVLMIVAPLLLIAMPAIKTQVEQDVGRRLMAPLADRRYWRLLAFGCWFSFFNGVTQSAQNIYPVRVLDLSLLAMHAMRITMRVGQTAIAPPLGRSADYFGNRPVMIASQAIVACGLAFFLLATPGHPWWLWGAFLCWVAYAGLNVALPNLMLKLSPSGDSAPHVAFYFAVTGVCYGLSTIIGGLLFDALADRSLSLWPEIGWDHFQLLFVLGIVGRALAVALLFRIEEPGAWRWRDIGKRLFRTTSAQVH